MVYIFGFYCLEPGPGAVMVGNLLRGTRIGEASGREIGEISSEIDKKVGVLIERKWVGCIVKNYIFIKFIELLSLLFNYTLIRSDGP